MIKGLLGRRGMPAFWLTINPSDLRDPIVLILGGIRYSSESFPAATSTAVIRKTFAVSNPVAVAQFFHLICTAIFEDLLRSHSDKMGALGQVSNHFGVVETNGRGMLHLHAFIWAAGNLGFPTLREQVLQDENFRANMINFLESIITQSIQSLPDRSGLPDRPDPFVQSQESNEEFDR
jgi:Helitron helicase-like domain at N-terminus